ncbi:MAG: TRAP transporter substrate-binding protein [Eubacteriales bacterium]|nr:TRAP transporter substrate-binding protein [Eubacteriales bacterium]
MTRGGKKWALLAAVLGIAGAVVVWRMGRGDTVVPEYVFRYAENQVSDYPTALGAARFAELVEERTEGRIQILVRSEGELGAEKDVLKQMQYGGIDFARVSLAQLGEIVPELNVLQMPYLYRDAEHMWSVLESEIGDYYLGVSEKSDLIGLSWYDAGARSFYTSTKKITCLEDLQGMRIRVQESALMSDMVEAMGARAVQTAYSDVYSVLELGTVDGAENNWPSYKSMNHDEVARYYTVDEHQRIPELQIISRHTWEKLSEEDQALIRECAKESALFERELWFQAEETCRQEALAAGTEIIELSGEEKEKFRAAAEQIYEKYCGDCMDIIEEIQKKGE